MIASHLIVTRIPAQIEKKEMEIETQRGRNIKRCRSAFTKHSDILKSRVPFWASPIQTPLSILLQYDNDPTSLPPDFAVGNLQIILVEKFLVKKWHLFKMSHSNVDDR